MEIEIRTDLPARIKVERKRAKDSDPQKLGLSPDGGTAQAFKTQEEMEILGSGSAPLIENGSAKSAAESAARDLPVLDLGRRTPMYGSSGTEW